MKNKWVPSFLTFLCFIQVGGCVKTEKDKPIQKIVIGELHLYDEVRRCPILGLEFHQDMVFASICCQIKAYNIETGKRIWRMPTVGEAVANALIVKEGKVYWVTKSKGVAVLNSVDARTGMNLNSIVLDRWLPNAISWDWGTPDLAYAAGLSYCQGVIYVALSKKEGKNVFAVSDDLSNIIWSQKLNGIMVNGIKPIIYNKTLYLSFLSKASAFKRSVVVSVNCFTGEMVLSIDLPSPATKMYLSDNHLYVVTSQYQIGHRYGQTQDSVCKINVDTKKVKHIIDKGTELGLLWREELIVIDSKRNQVYSINTCSDTVLWKSSLDKENFFIASTLINEDKSSIFIISRGGFLIVLDRAKGFQKAKVDLGKKVKDEDLFIIDSFFYHNKLYLATSEGILFIVSI